jgi:hypothetical protein
MEWFFLICVVGGGVFYLWNEWQIEKEKEKDFPWKHIE